MSSILSRALPQRKTFLHAFNTTGQIVRQQSVQGNPVHKYHNIRGGVLPKPRQATFPFVKMILVLIPFTYAGAFVASRGAGFLSEYNIFIAGEDMDEFNQ